MKKELRCLLPLLGMVLGFLTTTRTSDLAQNTDAPVLKKINQTYFVNGEEANDASILSSHHVYLNSSKALLAEPENSEWNMVSKDLTDGTMDFFYFDSANYSYRQFAFDNEKSIDTLSKDSVDADDTNFGEVGCPVPKKRINSDGSVSLYTPGYTPVSSENTNITSAKNEASAFENAENYSKVKVTNPNAFPYRSAGQLVITYKNILNNETGKYENLNFVGTGFLEGPDILVTAGHCLYADVTIAYNGDDSREDYLNNPRFPDSIYYYPARNGSEDPYGGIEVERIYLEDSYYLNAEKDWGCCKLAEKIGNKTGWLGKISNFYEENYPLVSFGYPGSKNGYMYESSGIITKLEDNGWYYRTTLDTESGQSGSPYNVTTENGRYACGIHAYSVNGSYAGGIRIDSFIFAFLNSFVAGDLVYEILPSDYGFADAYPTDENTETEFKTHQLDNGLTFRTRRYRTDFIQGEYIVMSSVRSDIEKKEAFIEYSFNAPVNKIEVDLTYWRPPLHEYINSSNGSAYLQVKDGEGWNNVFNLLAESTNLPTDRTKPTTYTIDFDQPTYVFRFYSEYHGNSYVKDANRGRLCIGKMVIWSESKNYIPLNGSEFEYEPSKWNNNTAGLYNCYAYALNTKKHGFLQPGGSEGHHIANTQNYLEKEVLIDMVELDASNYGFNFEAIGKYEQCDPGFYKVALAVAPKEDYHWYRQNYDGTWSHKPGSGIITNVDYLHEVIYDPETCVRIVNGYHYKDFYGFFQVNVNTMI